MSAYYVRVGAVPVIKPKILKIKLSMSLLQQLHQTSLPLSRKVINQLENYALKAATAKSKARPTMKAPDLDAMGSEMVSKARPTMKAPDLDAMGSEMVDVTVES